MGFFNNPRPFGAIALSRMGRETNPAIFDAPQTPQEETGRAFDPLATIPDYAARRNPSGNLRRL
jgi:hypothetical protein